MILSDVILGSIPTVRCFAIALVSSDSTPKGGNIPDNITKLLIMFNKTIKKLHGAYQDIQKKTKMV